MSQSDSHGREREGDLYLRVVDSRRTASGRDAGASEGSVLATQMLQLRSIWESGGELQKQIVAAQSAIQDARRELAIRDPRAASWHDATYLDISRPDPFRQLLIQMGPQTTYAGFLIDDGTLFAYAAWPEDQILEPVDLAGGLPGGNDLNALASLLFKPIASRLEKLRCDDLVIISVLSRASSRYLSPCFHSMDSRSSHMRPFR